MLMLLLTFPVGKAQVHHSECLGLFPVCGFVEYIQRTGRERARTRRFWNLDSNRQPKPLDTRADLAVCFWIFFTPADQGQVKIACGSTT